MFLAIFGLRFIAKDKLEYQDSLTRLCSSCLSWGYPTMVGGLEELPVTHSTIDSLPVFFQPILNNQSRDTFEVFLTEIIFLFWVRLM